VSYKLYVCSLCAACYSSCFASATVPSSKQFIFPISTKHLIKYGINFEMFKILLRAFYCNHQVHLNFFNYPVLDIHPCSERDSNRGLEHSAYYKIRPLSWAIYLTFQTFYLLCSPSINHVCSLLHSKRTQ
jgi:hypothetical protein